MKERNVILFTGQSGIKAEKCLGRLNQELASEAEIISIEKTMERISGKSFRRRILEETLSYQYEWWRKAFDKVSSDLNHSKLREAVFLTLHGVYYHQDKREFVCPIDFEAMGKLKGKVKTLIVLIDDIYDVYRRLMVSGEMYDGVMKLEPPTNALEESVFNLITILQWREVEITVSRLIKQTLDVPMYIVATKHPAFMIARLIGMPREDLQIFYLSHPISSVRKNASDEMSDFTGDLSRFARSIIDNSHTVLFMPGTIDELRVEGESNSYRPRCIARWSLPYGPGRRISPHLHWTQQRINPLNPLEYDISSSLEDKESVSCLMDLLCKFIRTQITSRDLSLVEQSKNGVIAYRPYFPHTLSGGVQRELQHNRKLAQKESSRRAIIASVVEEEGKARIASMFNSIQMFVASLDQSTKQSLQDELYQWLDKSAWIDIFFCDNRLNAKWEDIRKEVEKLLPENYAYHGDFLSYKTTLGRGAMLEQELQRRKGFEHILEELLKDPLKDYVISEEDCHKFHSPDEIQGDIVFGNCLQGNRRR